MLSIACCRVSSKAQNLASDSLDQQYERIISYHECGKRMNAVQSAFCGDPWKFLEWDVEDCIFVFDRVDRFSRNVPAAILILANMVAMRCTMIFRQEDLTIQPGHHDYNKKHALLISKVHEAQTYSRNLGDHIHHKKEELVQQGFWPYKVGMGYKKIAGQKCLDPEFRGIRQFITFCRTTGTSVVSLNEALQLAGGDTQRYPLILGQDGYSAQYLDTKMTYEHIAGLLRLYRCKNLRWTSKQVRCLELTL